MVALRRSLLVNSATVGSQVASPQPLAEQKHWPSDGIAGQAFLAAAISAVVLLSATALRPTKLIWS